MSTMVTFRGSDSVHPLRKMDRESWDKLFEEYSLNERTVSELCLDRGISRALFYRHLGRRVSEQKRVVGGGR
jgi:hypothetical protein